MRERKTFTCRFVPIVVGVLLFFNVAGPACAQFFNFGVTPRPPPRVNNGGFGNGWFGGDVFAPFQQQAPRHYAPKRIIEDFSKAPPPDKRDNVPAPERNIL